VAPRDFQASYDELPTEAELLLSVPAKPSTRLSSTFRRNAEVKEISSDNGGHFLRHLVPKIKELAKPVR
jgi:hypothetical protein